MRRAKGIEFARLFGFGALEQDIAGIVDFQHEAFEAKLGAKVGGELLVSVDLPSEFPPQEEEQSRQAKPGS
jgi:hypothetical protein